MRTRFLLGLFTGLVLATAADAGVVVVANFTPDALTFTVAEPGEKPRTVTLKKGQIAPVPVNGPAAITYPTRGGSQTLRLDPFNAYAFGFDPKTGPGLTGIELPGDPPERDARPEPNPPPREPVKIPVTLMVEDTDPRADALWQPTVRRRFEEAAAVVEAHSGIRFEFAGFATWPADPAAPDLTAQLVHFEKTVRVKPGRLAVGFLSRRLDEKGKEKDPAVGATAGLLASHVLVRDAVPPGEVRKVEVLTHYLGRVAGAVTSPFDWSVMRPRPGDDKALAPGFDVRFDPLNALAMAIWAEELRANRDATRIADATAPTRARLARVYEALLKAKPGETLALTYLTELEVPGAVAKGPKADPPKEDNPLAKVDRPPVADRSPRADAARLVVRAVVDRAKANAAGPNPLRGDDLTAAYVRAAAAAALKLDEADRTGGFLVGLAVALDDAGLLQNDALTAAGVKDVETAAERKERLAVLGGPTVGQRRDLCRRFAAGCGVCGLQSPAAAEGVAVGRAQFDLHRPAGLSFAAVTAELAGAEFARRVRDDAAFLARVKDGFTVADYVPPTDGLRDGLSTERFEEDYGGTSDRRFKDVLTEIRGRLRKLPGAGR